MHSQKHTQTSCNEQPSASFLYEHHSGGNKTADEPKDKKGWNPDESKSYRPGKPNIPACVVDYKDCELLQ
jgi:hypothetical protein